MGGCCKVGGLWDHRLWQHRPHLRCDRLRGRSGAEVIGLDFNAVSAVADELIEALNEHLVLFMPGLEPDS